MTHDDKLEVQCALERKLMKSYNYSIDDFELDDWRHLFDDDFETRYSIICKYFGTKYHASIDEDIKLYECVIQK